MNDQNTNPLSYDEIIRQRNEAWIPRIVEFMETDDVEFIMTGVAHLYGEDGVIGKLQNPGYPVEPL